MRGTTGQVTVLPLTLPPLEAVVGSICSAKVDLTAMFSNVARRALVGHADREGGRLADLDRIGIVNHFDQHARHANPLGARLGRFFQALGGGDRGCVAEAAREPARAP